jgi:hypothetical protein
MAEVLEARGEKVEAKPVVFARGFEMRVLVNGRFLCEAKVFDLITPIDADAYRFLDAEGGTCGHLKITYARGGPSYRLHKVGDEPVEGALDEHLLGFVQRMMAVVGAASVQKI